MEGSEEDEVLPEASVEKGEEDATEEPPIPEMDLATKIEFAPEAVDPEEMPLVPSEEDVTIFNSSLDVTTLTPHDISGRVETFFYGKIDDTIRHATQWQPKSGDVVCAAPSRCGQSMVLRWIDQLRKHGEPLTIADEIPWIESKYVEDNREWLNKDQPGNFRLFKTHQSCRNLKGRIHEHKDVKFITILREPVDFELAWYMYLEKCYETDRKKFPGRPEFSALFKPDDFVEQRVTMCHNPIFGKISYEINLLDWFHLRDEKNVLVLFYEDLVKDGAKVLKQIGDFLDEEYDIDLINKIVSTEEHQKAIELYDAYHVFNPEDLTVGKGKDVLHEKSIRFLEERWKKAMKQQKLDVEDYEQMYMACHDGNINSVKTIKAPSKTICTIS
uniref:Sulfotransferase domain-containing protein n=1 Tax=Aplanochytrium stocchinoi TaxID=215587 RepID=A0A7S3UYW5_9STRA|mmetsp:Transcript_17448/g.22218  ORF Transcript_17448/g.22218 Transcript_17448/m.22218 type:complete len:386 (+) Transcript_17448:271-1428(+)